MSDRKCTRDDGLRRDDRGDGGKGDQRRQGPFRRHQKERITSGRRVRKHQCALAQIGKGE